MKNDAVQTRINNTLREFFTAGPSGETSRTALRATYGFSLENQVLVVWASGTSDAGQAVAGWNSSIGIDLVTGARYTAERDLFNEEMLGGHSKTAPADHSLLWLAAYGQRRCHFFPLPYHSRNRTALCGKSASDL